MTNKKTYGTTREGFGQGLLELSSTNAQVVVLCGDLTESMRVNLFADEFPKRFFQTGVQEENMVGIAAGLAATNKIPFACSYAVFINNALGPIRTSVCYPKENVKIVGGHAGITTGEDGATHQALEDIATMRVLPNMVVVVPCDQEEAKKATYAIAEYYGPCYLRIGKHKTLNVTNKNSTFEIGKANVLKKGTDITIITCGNMVEVALATAEDLEVGKNGDNDISIEVINMHTIKPLDHEAITKSLKKTSACITLEEHQVIGGLGSAVGEFLIQNDVQTLKAPLKIMGIRDTFGESGNAKDLLKKYHLTKDDIAKEVRKIVRLKNKS
jgi:transketolase